MRKRGQVTAFVILGIVIVALVLMLLYFKTNVFIFTPSQEDLNKVMSDVRKDIISCIGKVGEDPIRRIALQGGYLSTPEGTYRLYDDTTISYLCYNMEETPICRNRMLRLSDMETQLDEAIDFALSTCIDVQSLKKWGSFEINAPEKWEVKTTINPESVMVEVDYPVTLTSGKSEAVLSEDKFTKVFNYPLGELYKVSQNIVDTESTYGEFDQLGYMLAYHGMYRIEKNRPYPDKLYIMNKQDSNYKFQFAIQGEPLA